AVSGTLAATSKAMARESARTRPKFSNALFIFIFAPVFYIVLDYTTIYYHANVWLANKWLYILH
ncbi:MAG TPA: hypothetical protein VFH39_02910, partial [Candidatus Saccharimonadales bacterium]|nr:hypothetical protein [Candidatus Saccharimonadales bacterium]